MSSHLCPTCGATTTDTSSDNDRNDGTGTEEDSTPVTPSQQMNSLIRRPARPRAAADFFTRGRPRGDDAA